MIAVDDLPALRAAAGQLRGTRNLRQIGSLCETSPARVAAHAGRLAFMERILTATDAGGAPLVDWMATWAQAGLTLHNAIDRVEIDGSRKVMLANRTAAILQLLDAAVIAATDGCVAASVAVAIAVRHVGGGVAIRMDCVGAGLDREAAGAVVAMAASAGVPAAWRSDGRHVSIAIQVDVDPTSMVAGGA